MLAGKGALFPYLQAPRGTGEGYWWKGPHELWGLYSTSVIPRGKDQALQPRNKEWWLVARRQRKMLVSPEPLRTPSCCSTVRSAQNWSIPQAGPCVDTEKGTGRSPEWGVSSHLKQFTNAL